MKEVIAHPEVGDRRLRRNGFQSRVRPDQRHGGKPAVIRASKNSHASVIAPHILYEPVNCVVGICAFVGRLGIAFVAWWANHYELPFGIKLSSDVLKDEDVSVGDEFFIGSI